MKIIILGAGQVGSALAENLVIENNDITVVDHELECLKQLKDKFDLQVIHGHAAYPKILRDAGIEDADMLIAVTNSDEINMIACQVAYTLFGTPKRIARIRSSEYINEQALFSDEAIPVAHLISPEQLVIDYIYKLVEYPGALQVVSLADNRVSFVAANAYYGGPLVGNHLGTLTTHLPYVDAHIAAIFRENHSIYPQPTTIIEAGDELFFIAATKNITSIISELQRLENPYKQILIVGGGNVGKGLALRLEKTYCVKLIERDLVRAEYLSETLQNTTVFCGDASEQQLLSEEHIENVDLFLAVTNDDEANIMSALLAKKMGAKKAIVLIKRRAYIDLVQGGTIDIIVYPQQATISALLSHVRKADIVNVSTLRHGIAEAIEAIAHGDEESSRVVGKKICNIKLPPGTTIGAIVREDEVIIEDNSTVIQEGDHVILYLNNKKNLLDIEKLFQSQPGFLLSDDTSSFK